MGDILLSRPLIELYYQTPESDVLSQGDLVSLEMLEKNLAPEREGQKSIADVYPYFFTNYAYGVIVNADCDIYWKDGRKPKVNCVTLAAVVKASERLNIEFKEILSEEKLKNIIVSKDDYQKIMNKFEKLVNNQDKLYFYLPEDRNCELTFPFVVRLDTSVSLLIEHKRSYDAFLKSRLQITIKEPYKSKLGENYAALYDRTGLTDVKDILKEKYCDWLDEELKKYCIPLENQVYKLTKKRIKDENIDELEGEEYMDKIVSVVEEVQAQIDSGIKGSEVYQEIEKIVKNKTKDSIAERIMKEIEENDKIRCAILA